MTAIVYRGFSGGEMSPDILGRTDLDKFQLAVATCRNFVVSPLGPASNRAGFAYVLEAHDSTHKSRLIPFVFNSGQTYVLEFGNLYFRVHTNAGTLLETAKVVTGLTSAVPGVITSAGHGFSNGDRVFLDAVGGMPAVNDAFYIVAGAAANTFQLRTLDDVAYDTSGAGTYTAGGTVSRVLKVTTLYAEADLFDLHYAQSGDILTIVHPSYPVREVRRVSATSWTITDVTFAPSVSQPTGVTAVATTGAGAVSYSYTVTAMTPDYLEESASTTIVSCTNDLSIAGNKNTVSWTAVTGASRYNVYRRLNGIGCYIGQTANVSFVDENITPDQTYTIPESTDPFATTDNRPSAVAHAAQRRIFAGTNNRPQNVHAMRLGTLSNPAESVPVRDSDPIRFRVADEQNRILHIVPAGDILLLTAGSEMKMYSQDTDVLTPTSVGVRRQSDYGASNVQPVKTGSSVLYAQSGGTRVREIVYDDTKRSYVSNDAMLLAPHLFSRTKYCVDIAFQLLPQPVCWCVRSDGVLLGLTYVPSQKVAAWHRHDTDGYFESVACVREDTEDAVYAIVRRVIDGRTVRYIERMSTRGFETLEESFFLDAGLTYSGAATDTITGLRHLEGKTVSVLADGYVLAPREVVGGEITLDRDATLVHVGLPYESDLQVLPAVLQNAEAGGITIMKNASVVYVQVRDTTGIFAGPDFDNLREALPDYSAIPSPLRTDTVEVPIDGEWTFDLRVCIRQSDPLPITVLSLGVEVHTPD